MVAFRFVAIRSAVVWSKLCSLRHVFATASHTPKWLRSVPARVSKRIAVLSLSNTCSKTSKWAYSGLER